MKTSIVFSILLVTRNFCGGIQINQTDSCPMTEAQWNKKKEEVTCQKGEGYFCSLNENNAFITGCLPAISISPNVVNCPFVVTATEPVSLPYEGKYTPCNITLIGCPQNKHTGYTILELYKYPLCLLRPKDRDHNITSYPDITTKSLSTLSTVESGNTTLDNRRNDGRSINAAKVAAIVIPLVLLLAVVAYVAVNFILWKRRSPDRGLLEFAQDLVRCKTCRFGYSITSTNDDADAVKLESSSRNRGSSPGESVQLSDIDESEELLQRSGKEDSSSRSSDSSPGVSVQVSDIDESEELLQRSGKEGIIDIVERGDEGELRKFLHLERQAIQEKKSGTLTIENVKEAMCLWIKMWDRPQPLEEFFTLLRALDNDTILFDLLLKPENYNDSLSMLVYAGRLERKDTVSFLLEREENKPTVSLQMSDKNDNSILHYVVAMKSLELTKKVLQLDNTLLDNRNIDYKTPFIMAAEFQCADIVQFLLQQHADVRDENYSFEKITQLCIRNMWKEIFDNVLLQNEHFLLQKEEKEYCHISQAGKVVRSVLQLYNAERDHFVESTLRSFPDMFTDSAYYLRKHPLIWSVCTKNVKAIELLLPKAKQEDFFNIKDGNHHNLLFLCIIKNVSVEILRNESLLSLVNSKDSYNRSPLMCAVKYRNKQYFDKLLDYPKTELHHRDKKGENVLHLTVRNNWYKKTEKLLEHTNKDHLMYGNNENITPLMLAVSLRRGQRFLTLLLERGSEIVEVDIKGRTVFHLCAETYHMDQTHKMQQGSENKSANSSKKDQKDWKQERKNCIKVLLECEKFEKSRHLLKVKDRNGKTPLDIANENNDTECLELFQVHMSSEMREDVECNGVHLKTIP